MTEPDQLRRLWLVNFSEDPPTVCPLPPTMSVRDLPADCSVIYTSSEKEALEQAATKRAARGHLYAVDARTDTAHELPPDARAVWLARGPVGLSDWLIGAAAARGAVPELVRLAAASVRDRVRVIAVSSPPESRVRLAIYYARCLDEREASRAGRNSIDDH